jgi:hypothetical protein
LQRRGGGGLRVGARRTEAIECVKLHVLNALAIDLRGQGQRRGLRVGGGSRRQLLRLRMRGALRLWRRRWQRPQQQREASDGGVGGGGGG